ncbi:NAD(P)-dependent oxidoreductase [Paracoccus sp. SCSIO 75233]|uniref:NAD(P)-dependent oxidoreductase n=1 Tax=Paracoccus sp. SCSIO 75233 TaxID=3017782 RepID=UPI0022F072A6|nr:NAD(P)-dependent oxidoreductase [Paracoccus sp. SCSIO 75233]WBU52420.1 NAD(P)-dependent oxidoreductase [Paracoccus sp. SCSIO 75233]
MEWKDIGFVGLGNMGRHMATRLLASDIPVHIFDREQTVIDHATRSGFNIAASLDHLAAAADVIFLSLPTPPAVKAVVTRIASSGSERLRLVVDLSTTGSSVATELAGVLEAKGIGYLDCPVSGGVGGAEKGTLTLMSSGSREAFDGAKPLLDLIGKSIFYVGPVPGQAQTMKLVNNVLSAASVIASYEGLVFGAKAGLDPKQMLDIINCSSGRSFATEVKIPECILDRSFPMRFATELVHKDVKLFCDEAQKLGAPLWLLPVVVNVFAFAMQQGMGKEDYGKVIQIYENWAGATFGHEPNAQSA